MALNLAEVGVVIRNIEPSGNPGKASVRFRFFAIPACPTWTWESGEYGWVQVPGVPHTFTEAELDGFYQHWSKARGMTAARVVAWENAEDEYRTADDWHLIDIPADEISDIDDPATSSAQAMAYITTHPGSVTLLECAVQQIWAHYFPVTRPPQNADEVV
jgi:hypothetical protein